jgi:hypothetical protein
VVEVVELEVPVVMRLPNKVVRVVMDFYCLGTIQVTPVVELVEHYVLPEVLRVLYKPVTVEVVLKILLVTVELIVVEVVVVI